MKKGSHQKTNQAGFSLMEVTIALLILLIALLGVFYSFSYAVNYNYGNSQRTQSLGIIQQEIEKMRSARFTPALIDQSLVGGAKTPKMVTTMDGSNYLVQITIDDDPFTEGIQVDNTKTLKEITVSVKSEASGSLWHSSVPTKVVFQRVRSN